MRTCIYIHVCMYTLTVVCHEHTAMATCTSRTGLPIIHSSSCYSEDDESQCLYQHQHDDHHVTMTNR